MLINLLYDCSTKSGTMLSDDDLDSISREESPCSDSPRPTSLDIDNSLDNMCTSVSTSTSSSAAMRPQPKVSTFETTFDAIKCYNPKNIKSKIHS